MLTKKILLICTLSSFSGLAFAKDYQADDIVGFWLTEEKSAVIQVKKNPEKSSYFGEIVWLKEKEKLDKKNPEEKLRKRPILGLKNTWGFKFDGEDEWTDGEIYDPKSGKTYSAKMELDGKDELELRGYVGVPLFGRTSTWTREKGKTPDFIKKD